MQNEVIYHIDQDDLLMFYNDQWDVFAEANGILELGREKIYKKSMWDFIHDAETRHIHEMLLKRVRSRGPILSLPFRCDSPELRRFMEMSISPVAGEKIEYRCRTVKTEQREAVQYAIGNTSDEVAFIRMCSWCNKIDVGKDAWVEIEAAISCLNLFCDKRIPQVSHTMCDACMDTLVDDYDE